MSEKQDFRITRTKKLLCNAFSELIRIEKIEDISINQLCDKAMIRRATFYNHFNDKLDFISFYVRYLYDSIMTEYIKKNESLTNHQNPVDYLEYVFNITVDLISQQMQAIQSMINSSIFHSFLEVFSDELQRDIYLYLARQKENGLLTELPINITASYCAGGIIHSLRYWLLHPQEVTSAEIKESYKKILERFF